MISEIMLHVHPKTERDCLGKITGYLVEGDAFEMCIKEHGKSSQVFI